MPVYMIRAGEHGPVKIGVADNVSRRLADMQVGNHEKLALIRVFEGGPAEETRLHERFADNHLRGEWHHFSRAMMGDLGLTEIIEARPLPLPTRPVETAWQADQQRLLEMMRNNTAIWLGRS
jgi:Meiotically up-regulated gene 113